jgi:hypothetical protein
MSNNERFLAGQSSDCSVEAATTPPRPILATLVATLKLVIGL